MAVRAKFRCTEKLDRASNYDGSSERYESVVKLQAVYGDKGPNKTWSKYTPNGTLEMTINNPDALDQFQPGKCYFLDFTEATEEE